MGKLRCTLDRTFLFEFGFKAFVLIAHWTVPSFPVSIVYHILLSFAIDKLAKVHKNFLCNSQKFVLLTNYPLYKREKV